MEDAALALLSLLAFRFVQLHSHLLPLEGGIWWGSTSPSGCTGYLDAGTPAAPGNGGRNSSIFSPDIEEGWRGEDVAEEAGAPVAVSFPAPL